jgi:predicted RNA-binding protein associated with RNAse of E/G family
MPYIDVSYFTKQEDNNCELNDIYVYDVITLITGTVRRFIVWTCKKPEVYT